MIQKTRLIVQWIFFGIFVFLMLIDKAQAWMGVILSSIILAAIFSRYYCGWICPINTLIRPAQWMNTRFKLGKGTIPDVFKSPYIKWIVLAVFVPSLGFTMYTITQGRKFPLPVFVIVFGVLTTLFINQNTWHRYVCPWGILLSFTGTFARLGLSASTECTKCGICAKICPAEAITVNTSGAVMDSQYCLTCLECQTACPVKAISFGKFEA